MSMPLYGQALRHSWRLVWRNKSLWLFGLFAAFLGQMGTLQFLIHATKSGSTFALYPNWLAAPKLIVGLWQAHFWTYFGQFWPWLFFFGFLFLAFFILFLFVSISSQGALIQATCQSTGLLGLRRPVSLKKSWEAGTNHFWRLLLINLTRFTVILLLVSAIGYGALNTLIDGGALDFFLFIFIFILAGVLGMGVSFWSVYAAGYVVVEEYPLLKAWRQAVRLLIDHWLVTLEIGLITVVLNIVLFLLMLLSVGIFWFPMAFLFWLFGALFTVVVYKAGLFFLFLFSAVFFAFAGALFTVFTTSLWTFLFMKMHKKGVISSILSWWKK